MTRAEIRKKLGIVVLEEPKIANKELTQEEAEKYEDFIRSLINLNREVDQNIKEFCERCRYYRTDLQEKCDSVRKGCSYGVTCKYIYKAKSQGKVQCNEDGSIWQHTAQDMRCDCGCNIFYERYIEKDKSIYDICYKCRKKIGAVKKEYVPEELNKGTWEWEVYVHENPNTV